MQCVLCTADCYMCAAGLLTRCEDGAMILWDGDGSPVHHLFTLAREMLEVRDFFSGPKMLEGHVRNIRIVSAAQDDLMNDFQGVRSECAACAMVKVNQGKAVLKGCLNTFLFPREKVLSSRPIPPQDGGIHNP
eukprot:1137379-Pelagomonas_calceolata.AAC.6